MSQFVRCAALAALVTTTVPRWSAEAADSTPVSGGIAHVSVHGRVLDPAGRPRPKARVVLRIAGTEDNIGQRLGLFDPGDVLAEVLADDTGAFAIHEAPIDATLADVVDRLDRGQRRLDIVAMAEGFGLGWTPIYGFPSNDEINDEINVSLQPAAVLEGTVENEEGTGLDGAVVKVLALARLGRQEDPLRERAGQLHLVYSQIAPHAIADAGGRFRIENLPADHYVSLWAYHRDHPQSYLVAAVGPHAAPQPINDRRSGSSTSQTSSTETDAEGRFRLDQLPDEPLSLMAYIQKGGGGPIRHPARTRVEMNQQDIRIVLDPSLVEEEE